MQRDRTEEVFELTIDHINAIYPHNAEPLPLNPLLPDGTYKCQKTLKYI